ncbi:MAG: hypothetical protein KFW07_00910 [Mycoplasmataceae bacterium]|nr:hypothetical protein [Mycoplasmataceae bacterium]
MNKLELLKEYWDTEGKSHRVIGISKIKDKNGERLYTWKKGKSSIIYFNSFKNDAHFIFSQSLIIKKEVK